MVTQCDVCRYVSGRVESVDMAKNYHVEFDDGTQCSEITAADIVEVCVCVCVRACEEFLWL